MSCPFFEEVVEMFLSEEHRPLLDMHRQLIESDPQYLTFHHDSVTIRLWLDLGVGQVEQPRIEGCMRHPLHECCVVDALVEAIRRAEGGG